MCIMFVLVASVLLVISTKNANIFEIVLIIDKVFQNVYNVCPRGVVSVILVISTKNANIFEIVLIVDKVIQNVYHVRPRGVTPVLVVISTRNANTCENVLIVDKVFSKCIPCSSPRRGFRLTCDIYTECNYIQNCSDL